MLHLTNGFAPVHYQHKKGTTLLTGELVPCEQFLVWCLVYLGFIMKIKINGKIYDTEDAKHLEIEFNGDLDGLSVGSHDNSSVTIINGRVIQQSGSFLESHSIVVKIAGNVNSARTVSGDVYIMGYAGSAQTTSGDINVNEGISGNVQTVSGDVKASGSINGGVSTVSGDIRGVK